MSVTRVKIQSDSVAETVIHPNWSGEIESERADEDVYFIDSLGSDFKFTKEDYTLIVGIPDCEKIEIWIEELCDGSYVERWRGSFTTYDLRKNETTCTATVKPKTMDSYECFNKHLEDEINVASAQIVRTKGLRGIYAAGVGCCTDFILVGDPEPTDPVCSTPSAYCFDKNTFYPLPPSNLIQVTSCFHRVRATGTPITPPTFGSGWTYISGSSWWRCPLPGENTLGALRYGRRFDDVLELMMSEVPCSLTVKSHFFGINNNHAAPPTNDAYTFSTDYLQDITMHQKSDVKCPDCTDEAQDIVWRVTWKKMLDDIKTMFNVYWLIDDGGNFILEHISYFEATAGLDVTTSNIVIDYGKRESSAPNKEIFYWADNATFTPEHAGLPIEYGECGTGTKERRVNLFSNDVYYIRNVENQADIADTGFCLVSNALDGIDYTCIDKNVALGWEMLHDKLHRHNRYFLQGTMNGASETFLSENRTRKLEPFTANICCTDGFDPSEYLTTSIGEATIRKVTTNYHSGKNNRVVKIEATI